MLSTGKNLTEATASAVDNAIPIITIIAIAKKEDAFFDG